MLYGLTVRQVHLQKTLHSINSKAVGPKCSITTPPGGKCSFSSYQGTNKSSTMTKPMEIDFGVNILPIWKTIIFNNHHLVEIKYVLIIIEEGFNLGITPWSLH